MLNDDEWMKFSDVAIAKACGVSVNFVGDMRSIYNPIIDSPIRLVQRDGKTYEQNTSIVGSIKTTSQNVPR